FDQPPRSSAQTMITNARTSPRTSGTSARTRLVDMIDPLPRVRASVRGAVEKAIDERRELDHGEARRAIGLRVGNVQLLVVHHRATGIDDVRNVAFALLAFRGDQGLAQVPDDAKRVLEVEEHRADRILPHRPDSVRQEDPTFARLDRRAAVPD